MESSRVMYIEPQCVIYCSRIQTNTKTAIRLVQTSTKLWHQSVAFIDVQLSDDFEMLHPLNFLLQGFNHGLWYLSWRLDHWYCCLVDVKLHHGMLHHANPIKQSLDKVLVRASLQSGRSLRWMSTGGRDFWCNTHIWYI